MFDYTLNLLKKEVQDLDAYRDYLIRNPACTTNQTTKDIKIKIDELKAVILMLEVV